MRTLVLALASSLLLAGCGSGSCRYPQHRLRVSIAPAACQALSDRCETLVFVAQSPQISSYIASGNSPCSSTSEKPIGCVVGGAREWSRLFCLDVGECGTYEQEIIGVFGSAVTDSSISISDTVTWCAFTEAGAAAGTCVGSLADQCNADAVLTLLINSVP